VPEDPAVTENVLQPSAILENMREGVILLDAQGRVLYVNRQMERWGWVGPEAVGRPCAEVFPHRDGACSFCQCREVFDRGQVVTHAHHAPDGRTFDVAVSPVFDRAGQVVQAVMSLHDVTERTELEDKLNSIYGAGREIASLNPETIARLSVDERIELLRESITRHTRDVLQYEHFEVRLIDRVTNRLEVVVAAGALEKVRALELTVASEGNGITGHVAATGESYLCGDTGNDPYYRIEMESARSCLCVPLKLGDLVIGTFCVESTAAKAFDQADLMFLEIFGNYVAIALNTLELLVVEEVTASGRLADAVALEVGVPLNEIAGDAAALLEGYIGHDEASRAKLKTVMANVANIREALRRAGQVRPAFVSAVPLHIGRDPELDGRRVLVADDEEVIRDTVSDALAKAGCLVDTARDGREVMALLKANPYDLIVADIRMPHKTGYEIYHEAHEIRAEVKVVLMTAFGYDPSHSIPKARQEGLRDVLFKPFKVADLKALMKRVLLAPAYVPPSVPTES
jgi:PAS domain S-box-containing protein